MYSYIHYPNNGRLVYFVFETRAKAANYIISYLNDELSCMLPNQRNPLQNSLDPDTLINNFELLLKQNYFSPSIYHTCSEIHFST